jgi:hypothetical protein
MKGKPFDWYLQEALKELERENDERAEKLLTKYCDELLKDAGVKVVIDNATGQSIPVESETPEGALAEALQKLTPGVKTIVWRNE